MPALTLPLGTLIASRYRRPYKAAKKVSKMSEKMKAITTRMFRFLARECCKFESPWLNQRPCPPVMEALDPNGFHLVRAFQKTPEGHISAICSVSVMASLKLPGNTEYAILDISPKRFESLKSYNETLAGLKDEHRDAIVSKRTAMESLCPFLKEPETNGE